jgi:hypothetical protein
LFFSYLPVMVLSTCDCLLLIFVTFWAEIIELLDSPQPPQQEAGGGRRRRCCRRQAHPQPRQAGCRRGPQPELIIILSSDSEDDAPQPRQTGGRRCPQPELIELIEDGDDNGDNSRKRAHTAQDAVAELPFQYSEYIRFYHLLYPSYHSFLTIVVIYATKQKTFS